MRKNEPKKHHFIPQFIIRRFCDEDCKALYYDTDTQTFSYKRSDEIFMVRNLYRDTINNPENPVKIEDDLAKMEGRVSKTFKKMIEDDDIIISTSEEEEVRLFISIMGTRAKNAFDDFGEDASYEMKAFYEPYLKGGSLLDFWKRNLELLVNCRSLNDVLKNPDIDEPIKIFIRRDMVGPTGMYLMIVERRGSEDFILGDSYPIVAEGSSDNGFKLSMYYICPLSPNRCLMMVSRGVEWAKMSVSGFKGSFFQPPKGKPFEKTMRIHVQKIYEDGVKRFNKMIYEKAFEGVVFQKKESLAIYKDD